MQSRESLQLTVEEMLLLPSLATHVIESLDETLDETLDDSVNETDADSVTLTSC